MERSLKAARTKYDLALMRDLKHTWKKVFAYARQKPTLQSEWSRVLKQDGSLFNDVVESSFMFAPSSLQFSIQIIIGLLQLL